MMTFSIHLVFFLCISVVRSHLYRVHWRIPGDVVPGRAVGVLPPNGREPGGRAVGVVELYD